jgi:hypothetical protein
MLSRLTQKKAKLMKKSATALFLVALILTGFFGLSLSHASPAATITLDPNTQNFTANVGDAIKVNIIIRNASNLWAWSISNLTFNASFLNLTDVSEGPFLQQGGETLWLWSSTDTAGIAKGYIREIDDFILENNSVSGDGVIATLTFQVVSTGASTISFNQTVLLNPEGNELPSSQINVNITVFNTKVDIPHVACCFSDLNCCFSGFDDFSGKKNRPRSS